MNRDDNNKGDNNYVEINLPEEGFIYGDDGPEVAPVDFDKQEELKHNSDGLDFPNKSKAIQTNEMAEEGHVTVYEENENKKDNGPAPIQGNPYNLSFPNSEVPKNVTKIDTGAQKEELIKKKNLLQRIKDFFSKKDNDDNNKKRGL